MLVQDKVRHRGLARLFATTVIAGAAFGVLITTPMDIGNFAADAYAQGNSDTPGNANNPGGGGGGPGASDENGDNNPSGTDGNQGSNGMDVGNAGGNRNGGGPFNPGPGGSGTAIAGGAGPVRDNEDNNRRVFCRVEDRLVPAQIIDDMYVCPIELPQ